MILRELGSLRGSRTMRRALLSVVCLVLAVQLASAASAAVIGSYTVNTDVVPLVGWPSEPPWVANLWFSYNWNLATPPMWVLFNGQDSDEMYFVEEPGVDVPDNVGETFWVAGDQDDPEFSQVVDLLTSEGRAYAWISHSHGFAYPIPWSIAMGQSTWNDSVINLHGYTIERIGLRIDSATRTFDPQSGCYEYSATLTAIFEGYPVVPEPSSVAALIVGISGLYGFVSAQRRKK